MLTTGRGKGSAGWVIRFISHISYGFAFQSFCLAVGLSVMGMASVGLESITREFGTRREGITYLLKILYLPNGHPFVCTRSHTNQAKSSITHSTGNNVVSHLVVFHDSIIMVSLEHSVQREVRACTVKLSMIISIMEFSPRPSTSERRI